MKSIVVCSEVDWSTISDGGMYGFYAMMVVLGAEQLYEGKYEREDVT